MSDTDVKRYYMDDESYWHADAIDFVPKGTIEVVDAASHDAAMAAKDAEIAMWKQTAQELSSFSIRRDNLATKLEVDVAALERKVAELEREAINNAGNDQYLRELAERLGEENGVLVDSVNDLKGDVAALLGALAAVVYDLDGSWTFTKEGPPSEDCLDIARKAVQAHTERTKAREGGK